MRTTVLALAALMATLPHSLFAQTRTDTLTPTIPESQIEALQLATPYEFISAATGIDEFQAKSAALAENLAASAAVKAFAAKMSADHVALARDAKTAGEADKVEIAGATIDGEQQGLLTKLEGLKGAEFDRAYGEAQVYVHQRAIAVYKGYAGRDNNLGRYAAATLPAIIGHYGEAQTLAASVGVGGAEQTKAPVEGGEQSEAQGEDTQQ